MSHVITTMPAIKSLADTYGLAAEHLVHTLRKVAMPNPHTDEELVSCLLVAREHKLNPLTKEIYFMRDRHGRIQAIVGVDGWIRKGNEHEQLDGVEFEEREEAGELVSMTCRVFRKDRSRPVAVTEYFAECVQPRRKDKDGPWQTHPRRMMRNRTLCQAYRVAFGFAGVMDPDEFEAWQMRDVTPVEQPAAIEPPVPEMVLEPPPDTEPPEPPVGGLTASEVAEIMAEIKRALDDAEAEHQQEVWDGYANQIDLLPDADRRQLERYFNGELMHPREPDPMVEAKANRVIETLEKAPNLTRLNEIAKAVGADWPEPVKERVRAAYKMNKGRLQAASNGKQQQDSAAHGSA